MLQSPPHVLCQIGNLLISHLRPKAIEPSRHKIGLRTVERMDKVIIGLSSRCNSTTKFHFPYLKSSDAEREANCLSNRN